MSHLKNYVFSLSMLFFRASSSVDTKIRKYLEKYYLKHEYTVPSKFKEFVHE